MLSATGFPCWGVCSGKNCVSGCTINHFTLLNHLSQISVCYSEYLNVFINLYFCYWDIQAVIWWQNCNQGFVRGGSQKSETWASAAIETELTLNDSISHRYYFHCFLTFSNKEDNGQNNRIMMITVCLNEPSFFQEFVNLVCHIYDVWSAPESQV